jgi:NADPH:quinone reductase-like Zn-dependent oxidoreductase
MPDPQVRDDDVLIEVHATGLNLLIRPNKVIDNEASHTAKAARAKAIWPEIIVVPWKE